MALGDKNKLGFINGDIVKPKEDDADFNKWKKNDAMVRCWLFASMNADIGASMMYVKSAKDLWDELKERYEQTNAPLLFQLKKDLSGLNQDNRSVAEFYCKLKQLWDEISSIEGVPECTCGVMLKCKCDILKKLNQADALNKLIQFLMPLNQGYENMKSNILAMDPLPTVSRAFHLVQQQERQKQISCQMLLRLVH